MDEAERCRVDAISQSVGITGAAGKNTSKMTILERGPNLDEWPVMAGIDNFDDIVPIDGFVKLALRNFSLS